MHEPTAGPSTPLLAWTRSTQRQSPCRAGPGTHIGVAVGTEDLLQESREAGEDPDAAPKAHGQDNVGLVLQKLEGRCLSAQKPRCFRPGPSHPESHHTHQLEPLEEVLRGGAGSPHRGWGWGYTLPEAESGQQAGQACRDGVDSKLGESAGFINSHTGSCAHVPLPALGPGPHPFVRSAHPPTSRVTRAHDGLLYATLTCSWQFLAEPWLSKYYSRMAPTLTRPAEHSAT